MSFEPAFGLEEESTMNEYAAPYTPGMPFFTLPTNSEPPYSSYSVTSIQPDVSSMYYYDSGYPHYASYCADFSSSSSIPQYNQDWYVGSPAPPGSHDWYSENEDPAMSYYPAIPSFDNNGFYAYGSCPYPEQLHGDPFVSSTVITTTPWENRPPGSTAATASTDFYESLPTSCCGFYGVCESKEEGSSTASRSHYFDDVQTAGKPTESSMEFNQAYPIFGVDHSPRKSAESVHRFKQVSSSWEENASTSVGMEHPHFMSSCLSSEVGNSTESCKGINFKRWNRSFQESNSTTVGMGNSHTTPTCFDFEGFPTILPQKDFGSNVQGSVSRKLHESNDLLEQSFGWTASYPADISESRENISLSRPMSSASDPLLKWTAPQKDFGSNVQGSVSRKLKESNDLLEPSFGWTASYPADISESRENISLSRPMSSASDPLLKWTASYLDDASVPRPNFLVSRPIDSASFLLESSLTTLPTLFGNYDKYKSLMLSSPQSALHKVPIDVQESKGKPEDARGIKSTMENIGNRQSVSEGTDNLGCRIKTKKAIHFPATKEPASHVLDFDMKPLSSARPSQCNDPSSCVIESLDVPSVNGMLCNDLSSYQEMDFHTKRMEDFLANCSKGGEVADDTLLIATSDGLGSYPTENASAACRHDQFSPILDIISSDCHPPKPSRLFPISLSKSASSFSTSQFVEGSTSHGVLGSSKLLHSSLIKTAPIVSAPQLFNESNGSEESKSCQSLPLGIDENASVKFTQVSFGNDAGLLSENMKRRYDPSISSKEDVDLGKECHTLVHTMHNLSVVLLASSSTSDNIRESEVQVLQSVICNLSQCLLKRMGLSTSTLGTAWELEKPVVSPNVERTQKAYKLDRRCSKVDDVVDSPRCSGLPAFVTCSAVGGKEVPVEKRRSFQICAEAIQSQMVNIEADLDLMKFEIRCLKMELETERLRKSHEGALKFRDSETSANKKPVNSGISPDVNLGIEGNDFNHTVVPISQEKVLGLPDLNLNPIRDCEVQTDATIKFEGILLSPNKSCGESILMVDQIQKTQQLDAETGPEQIEDPLGSKVDMGCVSGSDEGNVQCPNQSSLQESKDGSQLICQHEVPSIILASLEIEPSSQLIGQHKVPSIILASSEIEPYRTDGCENKSNYIHSLQKSILCDNSPIKNNSHLKQNGVSFENHTQTEILNPKDSNFFIDDRCQTDNIFLERGATVERLTESKSVICFRDLENVDDMHISKEVSSSELESGWEHIDDNEEDHYYSSDEDFFKN